MWLFSSVCDSDWLVSSSASEAGTVASGPQWAEELPRHALMAMALVGAWDPSGLSGDDGNILRLLGSNRISVIGLCEAGQRACTIRFHSSRWHTIGDSAQIWSWVDQREAFRHLAPLIQEEQWDRFSLACSAALSGQGSPALRRGICLSLALLGNSDGLVPVTPTPSRRSAAIVEQVLAGSFSQWDHLIKHLGLLAEASPDAFLRCIRQVLSLEQPQATEPIAPSLIQALSNALALLALDVDLLPSVVWTLAKLVELEPGNKDLRKTSQPLQILVEIFEPQFPKTNATAEERLAALNVLVNQVPKVAWELLVMLLHTRGMVTLTVPRPIVLPLSVPSVHRGVSGSAFYGQCEQFLLLAMDMADTDCAKWADILDAIRQQPIELLQTALRRLGRQLPRLHDEQQVLWGSLRSLLSMFDPDGDNPNLANDGWRKRLRQRQEQVEELARPLYQQLAPSDFTAQHAWLFGPRASATFPARHTSHLEAHARLVEAQQRFVTALAARPDRWDQLARLLNRKLEQVSQLARLLADSAWAEDLEIHFFLLEKWEVTFAIWFLAFRLSRRDFSEVERWLRDLASPSASHAALLAQLLTGGGADRDICIWNAVDGLGGGVATAYWKSISVHNFATPAPASSIERLIRELMQAGRFETASTAALVLNEPASAALRLEILRRTREAISNDSTERFAYLVNWVEMWDSVQPQTDAELAAARQEEAAWLPGLNGTHYHARFVPAWTAEQPSVFVERVRDHTAEPLLAMWSGWPGDGLQAEAAQERLYDWAQQVRSQLLTDSLPLDMLAVILARPKGLDSVWPCDALRRLLEEEHRQGASALFNALASVRRDSASKEVRIVDEWVQSSQQLAIESEASARQLAKSWPTASKLCLTLAESYRETAGEWQERIEMWNERDGLKQENVTLGPMFPLTKLEIRNFRGIAEATLPDLHPRLNILYGRNASGKTTLLDALAMALGKLAGGLPQELAERGGDLPVPLSADRHLKPGTKEAARQLRIAVTGQTHRGTPLSWQVERNYARGAESQDRESSVLQPYLDSLNERLRVGDPRVLLPVFAYYGVERALGEKAKQGETPSERQRTRLDGLAGALRGSDRFEQATEWFRREYFIERQERDDKPGYERPGLHEVRETVSKAVRTPEDVGLQNLRIGKELKLEVDFVRPGMEPQRLAVSQLSDGFRTHLALVMDLARRMAECNPLPEGERGQPNFGCNSRAVVLIDEVDAHLHPSWQKGVLDGLLAAFPQAQFFVTTHSALVLSSVSDANAKIWLLEDGKVSQVKQLYGKTVNEVLEDYQDTSPRIAAIQGPIDQTRKLLNDGKLDEAESDIAELEELNSDLTELVGLRNRLLLARRGLNNAPKSSEKPSE